MSAASAATSITATMANQSSQAPATAASLTSPRPSPGRPRHHSYSSISASNGSAAAAARNRHVKIASASGASSNRPAKTRPSTKADPDNTSGTMKWRMSLTAIASINNASAAPNAPRQSGLAAKLKPTANEPIKTMSSTLPRTCVPASRTEYGSIMQAGEVSSDLLAVELGAHLLGHHVGIDGIADHRRPDEDNQLGADFGAVLLREQIADAGNFVEHRNAAP